jgi:8-oxo-dGTP pyrophosphatase MutT (NUDIX family)
MPDKVNASKVVCYIVRDGQLLVFRHADYDLEQVGLQVPAGSIRPGESPEDAALREAREETGLSQFSVVRKLGEIASGLVVRSSGSLSRSRSSTGPYQALVHQVVPGGFGHVDVVVGGGAADVLEG